MSRLETRTKPILVPLILGTTIELNKYNQEVLATWLAMKLQVCEFSVPQDVVTPPRDRIFLMGRRIPPEITAIWIGHYISPVRSNGYLRNAATLGWAPMGVIPTMPQQGSFAKNVQTQTITIGKLVIHSITTTVPQVAFNMPAYASGTMKQIWPFQNDFTWPPLRGVDDPMLSFLVTDFERFARRLPFAPGPTRK